MTASQIIVLATPVFLLMIGAEYALSRARGRSVYRLNDAINSISLGMLSQLSGLFTKLLSKVGIYTAVSTTRSRPGPTGRSGAPGMACCWRWCSTTSATTGCTAPAMRWRCSGRARGAPPEPGLQPVHRAAPDQQRRLLGWIFYLPMAVAGVPPLMFRHRGC
jgi:alkylglycerol monooxygenase